MVKFNNYYKEAKENITGTIPVYLIPIVTVFTTKRFIQFQVDWLGFGLNWTYKKKVDIKVQQAELDKLVDEIAEADKLDEETVKKLNNEETVCLPAGE